LPETNSAARKYGCCSNKIFERLITDRPMQSISPTVALRPAPTSLPLFHQASARGPHLGHASQRPPLSAAGLETAFPAVPRASEKLEGPRKAPGFEAVFRGRSLVHVEAAMLAISSSGEQIPIGKRIRNVGNSFLALAEENKLPTRAVPVPRECRFLNRGRCECCECPG
jgi:hypothetical protein